MAVFAGFDLGGTRLKCGLVDERGGLLYKTQEPTPATADGFFALVESMWAGLRQRAGEPIRAAGFGLPGIFDLASRRILESPHTGGLDGIEIEAVLERLLGVPVRADNDANLAAFGEWRHGAGRGVANLILLTIGTGIGAGIIADGKLLRGARGYAGEVGHMSIRPDGEPCACGGRGCLETEASARAIIRRYREAAGADGPLTAEEIQALATAGDDKARMAIAESARCLGLGLGILINLLNPEKILLGGGVLGAGDDIIRPAAEEASRRSFKNAYKACRIERAALANEAGIIGAAAWAAEPAAGIDSSRGND
ncbi:MAG: ROK family protein [Candidatus Aminicenantes bacterium]|nr:ROK family protein [Candidatus Aminicenantes bacterium]